MLKIGIVCYPTFGGSGIVATELGKALAKKGNEVHFITYSQPVRLDVFVNNVYYHEVSIVEYPLFEFPPFELSLASKLVDVVKHEKLDLLHVHYAIPHAYVAFMAKQILMQEGINIPILTTLHGTDITLVGKSELLGPAISFAINQSDCVTAVSEDLKKETMESFDIQKDINVIPNFIDFSEYDVSPDERLKKIIAPKGERILVHISNFRPVKRVEDVIKIYHKLSQEVDAKLIMVGDGPEREKAEKLSRDLNLGRNVRFVGKSQDIPRILGIADLFFLPSETESFGLVALEAMAAKVPVVSSNTGGLPEVNITGETGFTHNVGDVDAMAASAIRILKNTKTLEEFKVRAYNQAQKFDLKNILPRYEHWYNDVLSAFKENGGHVQCAQ